MKKILPLLIIFIASVQFINAQVIFQKKIRFSDPSYFLNSVVQAADGNYYVAGAPAGTSNHRGIYLLKLNSLGDTLWTRSYSIDTGSQNTTRVKSMVQTTDGGLFITGYGAPSGFNYLFCSIRTDSLGDTLWTRTIDHPQNAHNYGHSGQQTSDGNFISFGQQGLFNADFLLAKLDVTGNVFWTKSYNFSGKHDFGNSAQETSDHGFILGGTEQPTTLPFTNKILIIKTDSVGHALWSKKIFGGVADDCTVVRQTSDGGYIFAGITQSFGAGGDDIFLIRTNSIGDTLWCRAYGTSEYDKCTVVKQTSDLGFIVTGAALNPSTGYVQYLLLKLDAIGNIEWSKVYGAEALAMVSNDVVITSDNGYIICGQFGHVIKTDGFGNSGCNESIVNLQVSGAPFIITDTIVSESSSYLPGKTALNYHRGGAVSDSLCISNGMQEIKKDNLEFSVFPNPATENLTINFNDLFSGELSINDILGHEIFNTALENRSQFEMNIRKLSPGIYMVRAKNENKVFSKKILIN